MAMLGKPRMQAERAPPSWSRLTRGVFRPRHAGTCPNPQRDDSPRLVGVATFDGECRPEVHRNQPSRKAPQALRHQTLGRVGPVPMNLGSADDLRPLL